MADKSHPSAAEAATVEAATVQSSRDPDRHLNQQWQDQLQVFWASQCDEIQQISNFKNHKLPISRIKKIMKSDRDVRMVSGEAPVLLAKACELFISELTLRASLQASEYKRRTLKKTDFMDVIKQTEIFDFLVDIFSGDEIEEEASGLWPGMGGSTSGVSYPYPPMEPPAPPMGQPAPLMGQPDPSGVVVPSHAMPWVPRSRYIHPSLQAWEFLLQTDEDNPSATGGNNTQGNL